jgi:hypothetical protein
MNSAAFVVECSKGHRQLMGTFVEYTPDAASYCGELPGLMVKYSQPRRVEINTYLVKLFGGIGKGQEYTVLPYPKSMQLLGFIENHHDQLQRLILYSYLFSYQGPVASGSHRELSPSVMVENVFEES